MLKQFVATSPFCGSFGTLFVITGRASENNVIGSVRAAARQGDNMIDVKLISNGHVAIVTPGFLAGVHILNILCTKIPLACTVFAPPGSIQVRRRDSVQAKFCIRTILPSPALAFERLVLWSFLGFPAALVDLLAVFRAVAVLRLAISGDPLRGLAFGYRFGALALVLSLFIGACLAVATHAVQFGTILVELVMRLGFLAAGAVLTIVHELSALPYGGANNGGACYTGDCHQNSLSGGRPRSALTLPGTLFGMSITAPILAQNCAVSQRQHTSFEEVFRASCGI